MGTRRYRTDEVLEADLAIVRTARQIVVAEFPHGYGSFLQRPPKPTEVEQAKEVLRNEERQLMDELSRLDREHGIA